MTFTLTYEFKLKPTAQHKEILNEWLEINRQVYNYALAERKDWYKSRGCDVNSCSIKSQYIISADAQRPTYNSQAKALTEAKKQYPHLKRVGSQVLQQTLKRVETAFTSMWERNFGFPRFKKRGRMRSFVFPQFRNNPVIGNKIKLPVIGVVGLRKSRPIPEDAKVKQVRIVKRVSGWYAMIRLQWDVNVPQPAPHGKALGIDVGLTSMIATSSGLLVKRPKFFVDAERKLKLLQQRVSRKPKGSNNWHKAHTKVAKLHEYVANCRKDWHRKLSHQLCEGVGMIFVEDLDLVSLSRGILGKHCLDADFSQFFNILEQTCFKRGVYFQKIDPRKTSQICPNCQHETVEKQCSQMLGVSPMSDCIKKILQERVYKCDNCGYTTDRDIAASQVVLIRGLAAVGHTVKMLLEGKTFGFPMMKESQCL